MYDSVVVGSKLRLLVSDLQPPSTSDGPEVSWFVSRVLVIITWVCSISIIIKQLDKMLFPDPAYSTRSISLAPGEPQLASSAKDVEGLTRAVSKIRVIVLLSCAVGIDPMDTDCHE